MTYYPNCFDAYSDAWCEIQAEMAWWAEQEAQYTEDRNNFLEVMEVLYEDADYQMELTIGFEKMMEDLA